MSRSQETFNKKQREKDRIQKKNRKIQKREEKKQHSESGGLEIDWSSAPENKTLTQNEQSLKEANKAYNLNK